MREEIGIKVSELDFKEIFEAQRKHFQKGSLRDVNQRRRVLKKMESWILKNQDRIHESVFADMKKPRIESDITEAFVVLGEIRFALKGISSWTKARKVSTPMALIPAKSWVQFEPKGVCLIISPWNFPFNLAISPLVSALAAGNSVILKPSELAHNTSSLIKDMVEELFTPEQVAVIEGDAEVSKELLNLPFDHIFFTGSPAVGRIVMKAASANLTPVTLELGGKSPVIVDESAALRDAAEKVVVGKFFNCGQTCIAPDYCLVHESIEEDFIKELNSALHKHFGIQGESELRKNPDYGRVINQKHFKRTLSLFEEAFSKGAQVATGGNHDESDLFFAPTIMTGVTDDMQLMKEEIFGPILPVLTYSNPEETIKKLESIPPPLVIYIFTKAQNTFTYYTRNTSSGAICWNDVAFYFLHSGLPFGGVKDSGVGRSHGFAGFKAFSNERSFLKQTKGWMPARLVFPPYDNLARKISDLLIKYL